MPTLTTHAGRPLRALLTPVRATRDVLRPDDLGGTVAWQTLVRDGLLRVVRGDAACPADVSVDPATRAGLLADEVPTGAVVTGRTAAWVHAGYDDAQSLDLVYPAGRHQPDRPLGARLWQGPLLHGDTIHLARVPVTAPDRTVVELVLHDPDPVPAVLALVRHAGAEPSAARRSLERRTRAVGRPRAREHLDAVEAALARADAEVGAEAALPDGPA
ncbi:hypothetical protein MWU57_00670 [Isoptericola sp. S6320L]|uniref:hypothetical protein n=1 Tax=Isoptericola sp. S6320L TaxID=2926411 RepID=UPI001FF63F3C|nr:hypothetical protein [Isoptericola sp. S6320L]MCK0115536.1 hypothetical protein [Isoptericola sp. S6320L]